MNPQSSKYNKNQNRSTPFNKAVFPSKKEMLSWASIILDLKIDCIEQLTTGAIFCQLLDACNPGSVRMNKVNWSANNENEYINNFKVFQQGLIENNLQKDININRLSKGKQQELNDLLQWIYAFYWKFKDDNEGVYNAKRNRGNQNFVFASHNNNNKNNYRKKQIIKDNYTNISLSSNNSVISDINSNYSNYNKTTNNFNILKKNERNNSQNRYNNFNNNLRNKSRKESKNSKYNEFYKERALSNNKTDFSFSPNMPNNNEYKKNNYKNNNINNNNNNCYYTKNRNYQNNRHRTNNNFQTNKFDESNIYNMENVSSSKPRNFPNIFESKTNSNNNRNNLNLNQELYNNYGQLDRGEDELYNKYIENDDDDNCTDNDMDIDMADCNGLTENEVQSLIQEERKDGNNIGELKKIIRKLRISELQKEKKLKNIHKIINNINRLNLFYLNKLKDIEYLYFNPIIKNSNDNKNTILRQLLCSEEDTTIYLDENNYAFLPNKKNKKGLNLNYQKYKSQPASIRKSKNQKIENNELKNLNYSSKKNYDNNYTNNLFDSNSNYIGNDNDNENANDYNDCNNVDIQSNININDFSNANSKTYNAYGASNNNTKDNSIINSYNYSQNTTQNQNNYKKIQVDNMDFNKKNNNINNEEEYYSNNNNNKINSIDSESFKFNYENQGNIKNKTQKIIKIKLSNEGKNKINYMSQNINGNENTLFNNNNFAQNENQKKINDINDKCIQQINDGSIRRNIQDENLNQNINYEKNTMDNMELYNLGKSMPNSNRKENKLLNEENMTKISTKTETKTNNIYNNITSGLLNESLVIHGYEKQ